MACCMFTLIKCSVPTKQEKQTTEKTMIIRWKNGILIRTEKFPELIYTTIQMLFRSNVSLRAFLFEMSIFDVRDCIYFSLKCTHHFWHGFHQPGKFNKPLFSIVKQTNWNLRPNWDFEFWTVLLLLSIKLLIPPNTKEKKIKLNHKYEEKKLLSKCIWIVCPVGNHISSFQFVSAFFSFGMVSSSL